MSALSDDLVIRAAQLERRELGALSSSGRMEHRSTATSHDHLTRAVQLEHRELGMSSSGRMEQEHR